MIRSIRHYILLTAVMILAAACSDSSDSPHPAEAVSAPFVISASRAASAAAPGSNELIGSWWVAFVNSAGSVAAITEGSCAPAQQDQFSVKLHEGTYRVIAFANEIPTLAADGKSYNLTVGSTVYNFAVGSPSPIGLTDEILWTPAVSPDSWTASTPIPMSGRQSGLKVTGRLTQPFNIEVVRQVAKMELQFTNTSSRDIIVHGITLRHSGAGPVKLFPTYSSLGSRPDLCAGASVAEVVRKFTSATAPSLSASGGAFTDVIYLLESSAETAVNENYTLLVDMTRSSGASVSRDTISALILSDGKPWINRNDHIVIPVQLNDWIVKVETLFYPPIGGYPAVLQEEHNDEFYVTFGSQGDFVITPRVREAFDGSPELPLASLNPAVTVESGTSIFTRQPKLDTTTYEILGTVGNTPGKARLRLSFTIDSGSGPVTYNRTIYIIRE